LYECKQDWALHVYDQSICAASLQRRRRHGETRQDNGRAGVFLQGGEKRTSRGVFNPIWKRGRKDLLLPVGRCLILASRKKNSIDPEREKIIVTGNYIRAQSYLQNIYMYLLRIL
jgi:hypothetical protein